MAWLISFFTGESSKSQAGPADEDARPVSDLLRHFDVPGLPPPSARVGDPKMKQRESQPMRLWQLWRYGAFAAMKGEYALWILGGREKCMLPPRLSLFTFTE